MAGERILIVEDEVDLALRCQRLLKSEGYEVRTASCAEKALEYIQDEEPHLVVTDLKMPGMGGMELLKRINAQHPEIQTVMMTAFSTIEDAVEAMRLGASNFVPKPFTPEHFRIVVDKVLAERGIREENRNLKEQLDKQYGFDNIIGKSPAMVRIFDAIKKISDTEINVLISGPSGTGKELIACSIHVHSHRNGQPFVPINCGALPEHLVESEIFGYEKGAFTGAAKAKPGLMEVAHGGTLFLDEIGELPLLLQIKFLRVLQDGTFRRVGSNDERKVDIRLICATNQDLEKNVAEGLFREDLFYRINTFSIDIPPLKKRPDDIPLLVNHFVEHFSELYHKTLEGISPEAIKHLVRHEWKGNVRELEHAIERAVILAADQQIQPGDLPPAMQNNVGEGADLALVDLDWPFKQAKAVVIEDFERRYITRILNKHNGNISRAAEQSGIDRRSMHRLMVKYRISAHKMKQSF